MKNQLVASGKGTYLNAEVEFSNFPFKLVKGKKRYVTKDFGNKFINGVFDGMAFPAAKSGLFIFSKLKCIDCSGVLPKTSNTKSLFCGNVHVDEWLVSIKIVAPNVICKHCSLNQLLSSQDVCDQISEAFAIAIQGTEINP